MLWLDTQAFKPLRAAEGTIDLVSLLFPDDLFVSLREHLDEILLRDPLLHYLVNNGVFDSVHPVLFEFRDLPLDPLILPIPRGRPLLI